jgi:hypothetical protein
MLRVDEVTRIIALCKQEKVASIKLEGLELNFAPDAFQEQPTQPSAKDAAPLTGHVPFQGRVNGATTAAAVATELAEEAELAQMLIDDPVEYEAAQIRAQQTQAAN